MRILGDIPVIPGKSADPAGQPILAGGLYYDTVAKAIKVYNGTAWVTVGGGGGLVEPVTLAQVLTSTVASGSDAIVLPTGGRLRLSAGANAYMYSEGVSLITPGFFYIGTACSDLFRPQSVVGATLKGRNLDGATSTAVILDSWENFATVGSKLVSVRNNAVERAFFNHKGALTLLGPASGEDAFALPAGSKINFGNSTSLQSEAASQIAITGQLVGTSGSTLTLKGTVADGASAVGVILDNTVAFATAGAKIASFRHGGTERASVTKDGAFIGVSLGVSSLVQSGPGAFQATNTGASATLRGNATDGSTAIATKFTNAAALANASAKIAAFYSDDGTTQVASITSIGTVICAAIGCTGVIQSSTGLYQAGNTNASLTLRPNANDGATAIANKIGNAIALATAGAKIAAFYSDNMTTERLAIDNVGSVFPAADAVATLGAASKRFDAFLRNVKDNSSNNRLAFGTSAANTYLSTGPTNNSWHVFNTLTAPASSDAIASFGNAGTVKFSIDRDGNLLAVATGQFLGSTTARWDAFLRQILDTSSVSRFSNVPSGSNIYTGTAGTDNTAFHSFKTTVAVTGTDLIAAFANQNTIKASIDKDGVIYSLGGFKFSDNTVQTTAAAGIPAGTATDNSGTPGNTTINKIAGKAAIAAGASSVVVTNSTVTAASVVGVSIEQATEDATLTRLRVVPASGSFTVYGNDVATAAVKFNFTVMG